MKKLVLCAIGAILTVVGLSILAPTHAYADVVLQSSDANKKHCTFQDTDTGEVTTVNTTVLDCTKLGGDKGEAIFYILSIAVNILTFGIGTGAAVGIAISGYQYMSARDNPAQVQKAKNRILQIVIGLAIYVVFWGIANFMVPGGLIR